jgi:hypothetical protein
MPSYLIILAALACGQQEEARQVIERHEEALSRLHSIRARYESVRSGDGGKTWMRASRITFLRSGQKERFHETIFGGTLAGQWRDMLSHRDLAYSPEDYRIMTGYDPDHPPRLPLTGQEEPRINAAIHPPVPIGPYGRKNSFAAVLLLIPAANSSLGQLYDASRTKDVRKVRGGSEGEGWIFSLETPDGSYSYVVTVSHKHNYAISGVAMKSRGDRSAGIPPWDTTSEVTEFYDYDFGLSLPRTIRTSNRNDPRELFEASLAVESINTPIPDAELALEFPAGTRVNDGIGMALHVWGDGKPELSFRTAKEMNNWILEQDRKAAASGVHRRPTPWGLILIFSVLSLALIALIVARSRIMKQPGSAGA